MISKFEKYRCLILLTILLNISLFSGCNNQKNIASTKVEAEANEMFDVLYSKGFSVEKKELKEGELQEWTIVSNDSWFDQEQIALAIQVLNDYGLPRHNSSANKSSNESLGIISEREQREKQKRELESQIERQLYTLPNVIRASVIIAQPENESMSMDKLPAKASISVVQKSAESPPPTIAEIQKLVAGSIPSLEPDNISVLLTRQQLREIPIEKLNSQNRNRKLLTFSLISGVLFFIVPTILLVITSRRRKKREFISIEDAREVPEKQIFSSIPSSESEFNKAEKLNNDGNK